MEPITLALLGGSTLLKGFSAFASGKAEAQSLAQKEAAAKLEAQQHGLRSVQIAEESRYNLDRTLGAMSALQAERGNSNDSATSVALQNASYENAYRNEAVARLGELNAQQAAIWQQQGYRRASQSALGMSLLNFGANAAGTWASATAH